MYTDNLITDRTLSDVKRGEGKGVYNALDLNRVELAVKNMSDALRNYGYYATVFTKTDWKYTDFPSDTEMKRYLKNVKLIVSQFSVLSTTPELPEFISMLNYAGANSIERNLQDVESLIRNMDEAQRYSGTFSCGNNQTLRGNVS